MPDVMTVKLPKQEVPINKDEEIAALTALEVHTGWQIILRILRENIEVLEYCILEGVDMNGKRLSDKDIEDLRHKRGIYKELLDTPKMYIAMWQAMDVLEDDSDPYFKNVKEMKKDVH